MEEYINKTIEGFKTLDVNQKYKDSAIRWLKVWLTDKMFEEYVPQIRFLIDSEKWELILDSFYQVIPFGTGGRRGLVGIGPNRINIWTIQASAQGHSQFLLKQYGEEAKEKGVVLTYDVREYKQKGVYNDEIKNPVMNLNCEDLAIAAAMVYAANGIKVYIYNAPRSTPQLSFTIRHLGAVAGDMFSASHNLPTDNGKKVYDKFGGQLIPPYDQLLVSEVTENVKKINEMDFGKAKKAGLITTVSKDVDEAYHNEVTSLSLSSSREIKIVYSPLHGTGLTSVYPIMQKAGFEINLDPSTKELDGAFPNVTFNIPNPEVVESFNTIIPYAKKIDADIVISSDPDADRIGLVVNHKGKFKYVNGNEIGIILTNYGISKYKKLNKLTKDSVVIKTDVTTSLISKIAREDNINCIGHLLVGFKYIGDVMNKLEVEGKMDNFIFAAEESNGYLLGNYARDKDSACAAIWICELAAELKEQDKTLVDNLVEIYSKYGYCHNYLTEIRLLGAKGMEEISKIMDHFRNTEIKTFGDFKVIKKIDRWEGEKHLSETDTASRNVIVYFFENLKQTQSIRVTVRPSGTEPKVKMYFEIFGNPFDLDNLDEETKVISDICKKIESNFMKYAYKIIDVDFPERGFLLFWQLPLADKLKYFRIEKEIEELKSVSDFGERRKMLDDLLAFLGSNPIQKVDKAFIKKNGKGILEFLGLK